jgi:hypothetical protein
MAHTPRVDHEGDGGIWGIRGSEAFEKYGSGDKADIDKVKRMLRLLERRTWSAPVQGVAVWGFLPADPFGRDSRAIIFAARNVTTDTIYIPDAEYKGVVDVVLKDSKGKEYRTDRRYSRKPEKTIFCGALESHAVVYMHPAKSLYSLPADLPDGEYTLTVVLANDRDLGVIRKSGRMKSGEWDAVKPWQGKVTTPPIKFTVKDGKAIPAKELLDSEDARQQSN